MAINPLGNNVVIGTSTKLAPVEVHGDLTVSGRITAGEGVWKEVIKFGGGATNKAFSPFTTIESMKDANGVVHLRGLLFVIKQPVANDYVCLLDPAHHPKGHHDLNDVRCVASSNDLDWGTLWVVGALAGIPADQIGWIKVKNLIFNPTKMISLDGLKFQSTI